MFKIILNNLPTLILGYLVAYTPDKYRFVIDPYRNHFIFFFVVLAFLGGILIDINKLIKD